jgi:hypothetical protein
MEEYFKGTESCIIMLMPKNTPVQMHGLFVSLSGAIEVLLSGESA